MDISTVAGLVSGVLLLGWGIVAGGAASGMSFATSLKAFVDFPSFLITMGGTFAAVLASYPLERVKSVPGILRNAFRTKMMPPAELIATLVAYAQKARRDGLLALEDEAAKAQDAFLKKGVQLVVDGTDPELVRNILETDLSFLENRHKSGAAMFDTGAALAPAFGMIGTLIGLIQMLGTLDAPEKIGPGMAVALVTTFYGSVLSNVVFTPLSNKLKGRSAEEVLIREVMVEGILSIQAGDNPRIVEEKLNAFLAPKTRSSTRGQGQGQGRGDAREAVAE
jgi:chemotaxis protein MotA